VAAEHARPHSTRTQGNEELPETSDVPSGPPRASTRSGSTSEEDER
jgi:hypothetical protein